MSQAGMTVVETATYLRQAKSRLSDLERTEIVDYLASRPDVGSVMEGTGGIRKIRWAVEGRGKSGGVRVIYYYHNSTMPIFLLTVFAKNEKANLTAEEKRQAKRLVDDLVKTYGYQGDKRGKKK